MPSEAQQRAVHVDHVADREQREVEPVALAGRGVRRRRAGRALAAAEDVRADDVEAVGVDGLAGADQRVPPVGRLGVAGQRVADVDRGVRGIAVGRVGDLERRDVRAGLERQAVLEDERLSHACAWRR